jgi:hypothetical protein
MASSRGIEEERTMSWLLARLKEPSTYAGAASICAALGVSFPAYASIFAGVSSALGGVAVLTREKGNLIPRPVQALPTATDALARRLGELEQKTGHAPP